MKRSWLSWLMILAMAIAAFAVVGCSDDDDDQNVNFDVTGAVTAAGDEYFDDYKIEFNGVVMGVNVPATTAFANLVADINHYYVIDMRSAADFEHAHIEGAVNVSMGALVDAIGREQALPGAERDVGTMLWDMFTGSAPYRDIVRRALRPRTIGRMTRSAASALLGRAPVRGQEVTDVDR